MRHELKIAWAGMGGKRMKVTVYGDSILKGVLLEGGKYVVNRDWERQLGEMFHLTIRNCARFGGTIMKMLPLIRRDSGAAAPEEEIVVLELGGNDCDFDWAAISREPDEHYECKTPPREFLRRYREAVDLIRRSGRIPVLMNLPPVHSKRYLRYICRDGLSMANILSWLGNVEVISQWQSRYSRMVEQVAAEKHVKLIDIRRAFPKDPRALEPLLCEDGIHPSRLGQKLIFDTLCAGLA